MRHRIIRQIKTLFEQKEDYNKPVSVDNFHGNIYIEYGGNGDKNKSLSIKDKHLNKSKPYLKYIIFDLTIKINNKN